MVQANPVRNFLPPREGLLTLLPNLWTNRFPRVNGKQPGNAFHFAKMSVQPVEMLMERADLPDIFRNKRRTFRGAPLSPFYLRNISISPVRLRTNHTLYAQNIFKFLLTKHQQVTAIETNSELFPIRDKA